MREIYKGKEIHWLSYELVDGDGWTLGVTITDFANGDIAVCSYSTLNVFPTQAEAMEACRQFGRDIIDGVVQPRQAAQKAPAALRTGTAGSMATAGSNFSK